MMNEAPDAPRVPVQRTLALACLVPVLSHRTGEGGGGRIAVLTKTETICFSPAHCDDARRFEVRIDSRAVEFDLMDRVWADAAVVFTIERCPPDVIDPALRYRLVLEQLDGSVDMQL